MPFPAITTCLVADSVRQEARGKLAVLGLFGVAPDVQMLVQDLAKPVELAFLVFGGRSSEGGQYQVAFEVLAPTGAPVFSTPTVQQALPAQTRVALALHTSTVLPSAGRYTFRMVVDGKLHYSTTFEVEQGVVAEG